MLEAIVFDMDGVLVDSSESNWKSFAEVFKKYGVDLKKSDMKKYLGRSIEDKLKMRKKEFNMKKDIVPDDFRKEALVYQLEMMKDTLKPDQYVLKLIQNAKSKGIKIAVATSSSKKRAIMMLELVNVYDKLDAFVTCEDVKNSKPEPDIFLKAADLLGIRPENCLVIEDAVNGIQAAISAGMKSLGKIGEHTDEELKIANKTFTDFKKITLLELEKIRGKSLGKF